jgi:hypothetical protein
MDDDFLRMGNQLKLLSESIATVPATETAAGLKA